VFAEISGGIILVVTVHVTTLEPRYFTISLPLPTIIEPPNHVIRVLCFCQKHRHLDQQVPLFKHSLQKINYNLLNGYMSQPSIQSQRRCVARSVP